MKFVFLALQVVLVLLFVLNLFFWCIAHASGHKIPVKTDTSVLVFGVSLIIVFILIFYINKRYERSKRIS